MAWGCSDSAQAQEESTVNSYIYLKQAVIWLLSQATPTPDTIKTILLR